MAGTRILVVKISSLGDVLHAFPAVRLLAETFPGSSIDWLVGAPFAEILRYHPDVSGTIVFPRKELSSPLGFPGALVRLLSGVRRERYDHVIDFQGLIRSALCARIARAADVCGFADPREKMAALLYGRRIAVEPEHVHAVDRNLRMVSKAFGFEFRKAGFPLHVDGGARERVIRLLEQEEWGSADSAPIVGICPGARWETKQWPPGFFADFAAAVASLNPGVRFVVLGSSSEKRLCEKLVEKCGGLEVVNLCGRTSLCELVEAIRVCRCLACNDSGPMHIAAALGVPAAAMFGPTDPAKTGPYGENHLVYQPALDCIKCFGRYCYGRDCQCHRSLDPRRVAEDVSRLLDGR